jgi:hypothetical protein
LLAGLPFMVKIGIPLYFFLNWVNNNIVTNILYNWMKTYRFKNVVINWAKGCPGCGRVGLRWTGNRLGNLSVDRTKNGLLGRGKAITVPHEEHVHWGRLDSHCYGNGQKY